MECPRCDAALTTFRLADKEALVCEDCEYVGIPADHRPESRGDAESWDDALERFLDGETEDSAEQTATDADVDATASDGEGEG